MTKEKIHIGDWVNNFGSIFLVCYVDGNRVILVNEVGKIEYQDYFTLCKAQPPDNGFQFQIRMFMLCNSVRRKYLKQK